MKTAISPDLLPVGNFMQSNDTQARLDCLEHFLGLANRGALAGCSGGEDRAAVLADKIVDCVPGLDAKAVAGAIEFVRLAAQKPGTARDLLSADG